MKQESKQLVLKDLCARLPYGVKCKLIYNNHSEDATLFGIDKYGTFLFTEFGEDVRKFVCKPYLFPMSSMTEEQKREYEDTLVYHDYTKGGRTIAKAFNDEYVIPYWFVDFCNKNHLDYRGLIPKGLAIDCTNLNIY